MRGLPSPAELIQRLYSKLDELGGARAYQGLTVSWFRFGVKTDRTGSRLNWRLLLCIMGASFERATMAKPVIVPISFACLRVQAFPSISVVSIIALSAGEAGRQATGGFGTGS